MPSRPSSEDAFVERVTRRISELRQLEGLTQEEFAARLGTAPRLFQRIEAGQNLTLRTIARIAAVLGVEPEEVIVGLPARRRPAARAKK